jgi:hypothetical protein
MKKYLVPCVALVGIALLASSGHAANLIMKGRVLPQGGKVSVPISVTAVGGSTQLWGLDMALAFDNAGLTALDPANAFTLNGATASDVVLTSAGPFVGGGTQPSLYVGIVKGTAAMPTTDTSGKPSACIGLLKLTVTAGTAKGTAINIAPIASYNVKNDGTGADVSRPGATGATSTATAGDPVVAEAITTLDYIPGSTAPSGSNPDLRVPLHTVAVGTPGDVSNDGAVNIGDLSNVAAVLVNKAAASWTVYKRIAADVAPLNGYVPVTTIGGSGANGGGYGDSVVNVGDLSLIAAKLVNKPSAANFPVNE